MGPKKNSWAKDEESAKQSNDEIIGGEICQEIRDCDTGKINQEINNSPIEGTSVLARMDDIIICERFSTTTLNKMIIKLSKHFIGRGYHSQQGIRWTNKYKK